MKKLNAEYTESGEGTEKSVKSSSLRPLEIRGK
jgi:hypothetical protein